MWRVGPWAPVTVAGRGSGCGTRRVGALEREAARLGTTGAGSSPFGDEPDLVALRDAHVRRLTADPGGAPALSRLAALAARLLGAPSGQVSLVGQDQVVMGGSGQAESTVGRASPAGDSLCTVTAMAGGPLLVDDARADERVRGLPPVTTGAVRSYLGVPLVVDDVAVGALCVFGPETRAWTAADAALLEQLAQPVLTELELSALARAHEDDRLAWQLAVDAAGVGAFDLDLENGELRWDERLLDLFGLEREAFGGTLGSFDAWVHPDDLERVHRALNAAVESVGHFESEYRIVRPDGALRWIAARGQALPGPDGRAVRFIGAAYDTTATQEAEARVARALEAMPTAFFHLDPQWRFTYANPEAERLLGGIGSDVVGHVIWELFPAAVGSDFERHYRGAAASGRPVAFEAYYPPPLDAHYEVRAWPTPDGLSVYFVDVTDRRRAQDAVESATQRATLLADVTRALTDTLDPEVAVRRLAQLLVPVLADWCVVTLVDGSDPPLGPLEGSGWRARLRDVGWWHADDELRPLVEAYSRTRIAALTDESFVARVVTTGEATVLDHGATGAVASVLGPGEARDVLQRLAPASAVVMPLPGRGGLAAGLVTVFRGVERAPFDDEELQTLADAAGRAGLALDNARMYAGQRELAEALQRSLLTAPPSTGSHQVAVRYEPASETAKVGGDWYDAFSLPDGSLALVIGDVTGHDLEAAAAMGQLRSLVRGVTVTSGEGPAEVLRRVDGAMLTLEVDTIATATVAYLGPAPADAEPGSAVLRWSGAGHPPPVLVRPAADGVGGPVAEVLWGGNGAMLGLDPSLERAEHSVVVPPGATVLLYTDGLVERRRQTIDEGLARLTSVVTELVAAGLPLERLCDELLVRLLPQRTDDDVAVVAVRARD